ncbi:hypothetical protein K435DRAFT_870590 [Dendrothele bispora CBS 962.96]|uniref:Uncharacterized protein n=1 Tax=Dendrothele bispora (strain CBS 962.96) TaxID=1314807 RepID=A0A4S8L676_DENBC|nr:hypothetical protein K435DRAFT_870590 [Dendrothele bispora CBS 962.96]
MLNGFPDATTFPCLNMGRVTIPASTPSRTRRLCVKTEEVAVGSVEAKKRPRPSRVFFCKRPQTQLINISDSQADINFSDAQAQWQNPANIFSVLMTVGGDIIQAALAQLVSSAGPFTPVAFSFGWVSYSVSSVLAAIRSHRLAPMPDCSCLLINMISGDRRPINSWILSRLVHDYEHPNIEGRKCERGLTIAFFKSIGKGTKSSSGKSKRTGLGVSVIPVVLRQNWVVLIITCGGTILAQLQGALPQWKKELWNARTIENDEKRVFCLTKGNGSTDVIVVRCSVGDLILSNLTGARETYSRMTVPATFTLTLAWLVLLFTAQGLKEDIWFLIAVGGIGMIQNLLVSGARCKPAALGFHLEEDEIPEKFQNFELQVGMKPAHDIVEKNIVHSDKVFRALKKAEEIEKKVGIILLDIFFPEV